MSCLPSSLESSEVQQSSTSCGKATGLDRIGRVIVTGIEYAAALGTKAFALLFAVMLMLLFGSNAMAQTPAAPTTPDVPVLVDFGGLMDALVSSIQGYMGLVVVLIIAIGAIVGFLAWTVGKKRTV